MPTPAGGRRIVVGFDRSDYSRQALDWAAREAALRGVGLLVVHAFDDRVAGIDPTIAELVVRDAQDVLDQAVTRARGDGVDAEGMLARGQAADVLIEVSTGEEMLVVGSRGRGGLVGALLGSVSTACVHHGACPVVVVPPPDRVDRAQRPPRGTITQKGASPRPA